MTSAENSICNLCNSKKSNYLYTKNKFDILKCEECNLVYTKIPENFDLNSIYDSSYFEGGQSDGYSDYIGSEKTLKAEFEKILQTIQKHIQPSPKKLKLLEIGSAYGFFLDIASPNFDCVGIEVAEDAVEFSRKKKNKVYQGIVTQQLLDEIGKVDVIVMLDVIEHLENPKQTLQMLYNSLNKDGIIVIVTGDISGFLPQLMQKNWRLMTPPQHTFFFSKQTLADMCQKVGFSIKEATTPWKIVPIGLAAYQVGSRLGCRIKPLENIKFGLPINLFDTVRIIATKNEE